MNLISLGVPTIAALTAAVKNQISKPRSTQPLASLSIGNIDANNGAKLTKRKPSPPANATLPHNDPGTKGSSETSYFFLGSATNSIASPGPQNKLRVSNVDCCPP